MVQKKSSQEAAGHNSVSPYFCEPGSNVSVGGIWKISMMGNKK